MTARSTFWLLLLTALALSFIPSFIAGVAAFGLVCMAVGVGVGGVMEWQR